MNNLKQTYSNWDVQKSTFQNKQCLDEQRFIRDLSFFSQSSRDSQNSRDSPHTTPFLDHVQKLNFYTRALNKEENITYHLKPSPDKLKKSQLVLSLFPYGVGITGSTELGISLNTSLLGLSVREDKNIQKLKD